MLIVNELEFNGLTVKLETHLIETKSSCSDFISFSESLVSLLKRDDFRGISRNPTLPKNLFEWNKENLLTLKTNLQQCLPYIRYSWQ
ncbi:hypothetical protein Glove_232g156 [Diversispora epigaea]|uniref:Uncharacterized protein n=1 Tax=Diversispora epigaea TaxID=1348612 RepID=A0A397IJN0_9GLOM|nr:hypothetical protein Glove_232g156 [Diversispora epigaea]